MTSVSEALTNEGQPCESCGVTPPGFFQRYRGFLFSTGTLITAANALLLLIGFAIQLAGYPQLSQWFYLASALVGGFPIFKLAAVNVFTRFDLTAGVMVSIAMIAAILIGEYERGRAGRVHDAHRRDAGELHDGAGRQRPERARQPDA